MSAPPVYDHTLAGLPRDVVDAALSNTSASITKLVASTPEASWYAYGGSLARALVAFYAGRGLGWALDVTGDEATMIGTILVFVAIVVWGVLQKKWSAWRTHQTALATGAASAEATVETGQPTVVALEPPPNKM